MELKNALRTLLFKEDKSQGYHQLYTPWGEHLDPNQILMEYPRPQLRRDNYRILNGYWNYCITKKEGWPTSFDGEILVPFSPESDLSGVNRQLKPDEFLWYERSINIDTKYVDYRCILHFGAVDQYCEVYINKRKATEHMGGYLPFSVDITQMLHIGENQLTVKVIDKSDSSYHSRGKQKLDRGGMFYTAQSGIWQTVWLEWVPYRYIQSLRITPLMDQNAVYLEILLNQDKYKEIVAEEQRKDETTSQRDGLEPTISTMNSYDRSCSNTVCPEEKVIYTDRYENGDESYDWCREIVYHVDIYADNRLIHSVSSRMPILTIPLSYVRYWSPEDPFLYDMVITAGEDRVESYFAMRKFEIKRDEEGILRLYLNYQPYFQNGLLDQGYWPDGLYTAPSDEALIYDIKLAKDLGFNMIRKHLKIEPLRWYYHCDRLGMIVWQDMVNGGSKYNTCLVGYLPTLFPNLANCIIKDKNYKHYKRLGRKDEKGRQEWLKECIDTVNCLYNCPCIAVWVPFNEGWGQFDAAAVYELIQTVDKTRLIDHASGWFDQGAGDFKSIHNYFHRLKVKAGKRPVVLSEFGGYACYIADHSYSWQIYGYRIYLTKEDLNKDFQKLFLEEIPKLKKKGLAAAVYTQLSDVEDEVNGLVTYDRKVCKVKPISKV
jgi:beta-galactosidase/beta-glucuronidase